MGDEKPKIEPWNYNKLDARNSPEVSTKGQLGWSDAGKGLGKSRKEYNMPRIYILVPMVVIILVIAATVSRVLALVLEGISFLPLIILYDRTNTNSGKGSAIIFWIVLALVLAAIIMIVPNHFY